LCLNFQIWKKTKNLNNLPYVIFAHEDVYEKIIEDFKDIDNLEIIKWKFEKASNEREEMLSAFIFGVADNIKTKYWMKLDCDVTPIKDYLEIPEIAFNSIITASSWGYTKVKGDDTGNKEHWLNRLDNWAENIKDFENTEKLFPEKIDGRIFKHKRITSFCEIEKTEWTKYLAKLCGDKLPVPSQDTTTWYVAKRLGKKISTFKFRKYLNQ
jgi:hypothetical protein